MAINPKIDAKVDPAALALAFADRTRLHIPNFFKANFANHLSDALKGPAVPWMRTMVIQGKGVEAPLQAYGRHPQRFALEAQVADGARKGFQYQYDTYRISDQVEAGHRLGGPMEPIEAVYDFLNSDDFLGFVKVLTGDHRPAYCDSHASRYGAGNFLNGHHDGNSGTGRLYAYVLNLTPNWQTDWGGVLLFQDDARNVTEGFAPKFNALNIFKVPQWHSVSQVASFVTAHRYSITGWVRTAPGLKK